MPAKRATTPSRHGGYTTPKPGGRTEQVILFRIGQQAFAISANVVQEIRSTDNLAVSAAELPGPEFKQVRHTIVRGRRTIYVVHGATLFGLPSTTATLVFLLRRSRAALLVDTIDRMATISRLIALPQAFCGEERSWYRGLAAMEDTVVPVVNPDGLLSPSQLERLDAALAAKRETNETDRAAEASAAEDETEGEQTTT